MSAHREIKTHDGFKLDQEVRVLVDNFADGRQYCQKGQIGTIVSIDEEEEGDGVYGIIFEIEVPDLWPDLDETPDATPGSTTTCALLRAGQFEKV